MQRGCDGREADMKKPAHAGFREGAGSLPGGSIHFEAFAM